MMQFIEHYLGLAVKCRNLEVVLDVLAFCLSALKQATAVVVHALQVGGEALRSLVLRLVSIYKVEIIMERDALEGEAEAAASAARRTAGATRWLHVAFELHHHTHSIVSANTVAHIEEVILALYPHSSLFVWVEFPAKDCSPSVDAVDGMNLEVREGDVPMIDMAADGAVEPAPALALARAPLSAVEVLAVCTSKWGLPRVLRSDLGKRAKGCFAGRSSSQPNAASSSSKVNADTIVDTGAVMEVSVDEQRPETLSEPTEDLNRNTPQTDTASTENQAQAQP